MQQQITAEREKRALIAKSEGERQQEINVADGGKAGRGTQVRGEKQAAINRLRARRPPYESLPRRRRPAFAQ